MTAGETCWASLMLLAHAVRAAARILFWEDVGTVVLDAFVLSPCDELILFAQAAREDAKALFLEDGSCADETAFGR